MSDFDRHRTTIELAAAEGGALRPAETADLLRPALRFDHAGEPVNLAAALEAHALAAPQTFTPDSPLVTRSMDRAIRQRIDQDRRRRAGRPAHEEAP